MASSTDRPASAALTTTVRRLRRALPGRTAPDREQSSGTAPTDESEGAVPTGGTPAAPPTPTTPTTPAKPPAARGFGPGGIPGRTIRVVPPPGPADPRMDLEVSDPSEAAAVRAGWQLVDVVFFDRHLD